MKNTNVTLPPSKVLVGLIEYNERVRKEEREEFLNLLLNDEVVKNNRALQEKYMELYDKYTRK